MRSRPHRSLRQRHRRHRLLRPSRQPIFSRLLVLRLRQRLRLPAKLLRRVKLLRRLPPHQNRRPIFWPPHVLRQRRKRLVEQLRLLRPLPSQPLIFSPPLVPRRGRVVRLQLLSQQHQPLRRSQRHLPLPQVLV